VPPNALVGLGRGLAVDLGVPMRRFGPVLMFLRNSRFFHLFFGRNLQKRHSTPLYFDHSTGCFDHSRWENDHSFKMEEIKIDLVFNLGKLNLF
jgi:hypothetical protein